MDRMNHELARIRYAEIQARAERERRTGDLVDYRTGTGVLRIIRMGRR